MKKKLLFTLALVCALGLILLLSEQPTPVYASSTVTVTPAAMNGWFFMDDGFPGATADMVTGPATPPLSTGSVHVVLNATARETISTVAYAGTRLDKITRLQYSTYRSSVDAGNNLAISLQFDVDYDLTDAFTSFQGRLVFEPYQGAPGTVIQNTWQTWDALAGKWWATGAPGNTLCPQATPCTWTQVKTNWPNAGLRASVGLLHLKAGGPAPGFDGNADALIVGVTGNDTTYDFEPGTTGLVFVPETSFVSVGGTTTVFININSVANLYGYQFQVNYDKTKATASAVFVDTWFKTTSPDGIQAGGGWNASCNNAIGYCLFGAARLNPASPINGSGTVAAITFTGVSTGTVPLTFTSNFLTDRDASPITFTVGTGTLNVYGVATVTGTVTLQGRPTPITTGTVTLTDEANIFPPTVVNFSATSGAFTALVPALSGGTTYDLLAAHALYLGNKYIGLIVTPGGSFSPTPATTKLLGGDSDNSGTIDVSDLSCVGGAFGGSPTLCGATGSSDINADGTVNIFDLVLVGGNYGLATPQPW